MNILKSINLKLPFNHRVLAIIGEFVLVEKSGEYVTYSVDSEGHCFYGHYLPKDCTTEVEANHHLLCRAGWMKQI